MSSPKASTLRPQVPVSGHPVQRRKYIIATPMIQASAKEVVRWVAQAFPGNMILGNPRHGKTSARRYTARVLRTEWPGIVIYGMQCHKDDKSKASGFLPDLCEAAGYLDIADSVHDLRRGLTKFFIGRVRRSGQNKIVFMIDEAQHLSLSNYTWLVGLTNDLEEAELDCTIVLYGQCELYQIKSDFISAGHDEIVGRYMNEAFDFVGLRGVADMRHCLNCYDDPAQHAYPEGSDWSFTRYFFPEAYQKGWRLASLAESIWDAFAEVRITNGVPPVPRTIRTLSFFRVVEAILMGIGAKHETDPRISMEELTTMVVASGFGSSSQQRSSEDEPDDDDASDQDL